MGKWNNDYGYHNDSWSVNKNYWKKDNYRNDRNSSWHKSDRKSYWRGGSSNDNDSVSKWLTYVLRHGASEEDVYMDKHGYVSANDLIALREKEFGKTMSLFQIRLVVETCPKQRFELWEDSQGKTWVRATQGHSIREVQDSVHRPLRSAEDLGNEEPVHGTFLSAWLKIRDEGLKTMQRNHIHMCMGLPGTGVISGMREDADVAIYINVKLAMESGITFVQSSNGVILTAGEGETHTLSPRYFTRVFWMPRDREKLLIWTEKHGDLLEGLRKENEELDHALERAEWEPKKKPAAKKMPMPKKMPESLQRSGSMRPPEPDLPPRNLAPTMCKAGAPPPPPPLPPPPAPAPAPEDLQNAPWRRAMVVPPRISQDEADKAKTHGDPPEQGEASLPLESQEAMFEQHKKGKQRPEANQQQLDMYPHTQQQQTSYPAKEQHYAHGNQQQNMQQWALTQEYAHGDQQWQHEYQEAREQHSVHGNQQHMQDDREQGYARGKQQQHEVHQQAKQLQYHPPANQPQQIMPQQANQQQYAHANQQQNMPHAQANQQQNMHQQANQQQCALANQQQNMHQQANQQQYPDPFQQQQAIRQRYEQCWNQLQRKGQERAYYRAHAHYYYNSCTHPEQQAQITAHLGQLDRDLAQLTDQVSKLESQLQPSQQQQKQLEWKTEHKQEELEAEQKSKKFLEEEQLRAEHTNILNFASSDRAKASAPEIKAAPDEARVMRVMNLQSEFKHTEEFPAGKRLETEKSQQVSVDCQPQLAKEKQSLVDYSDDEDSYSSSTESEDSFCDRKSEKSNQVEIVSDSEVRHCLQTAAQQDETKEMLDAAVAANPSEPVRKLKPPMSPVKEMPIQADPTIPSDPVRKVELRTSPVKEMGRQAVPTIPSDPVRKVKQVEAPTPTLKEMDRQAVSTIPSDPVRKVEQVEAPTPTLKEQVTTPPVKQPPAPLWGMPSPPVVAAAPRVPEVVEKGKVEKSQVKQPGQELARRLHAAEKALDMTALTRNQAKHEEALKEKSQALKEKLHEAKRNGKLKEPKAEAAPKVQQPVPAEESDERSSQYSSYSSEEEVKEKPTLQPPEAISSPAKRKEPVKEKEDEPSGSAPDSKKTKKSNEPPKEKQKEPSSGSAVKSKASQAKPKKKPRKSSSTSSSSSSSSERPARQKPKLTPQTEVLRERQQESKAKSKVQEKDRKENEREKGREILKGKDGDKLKEKAKEESEKDKVKANQSQKDKRKRSRERDRSSKRRSCNRARRSSARRSPARRSPARRSRERTERSPRRRSREHARRSSGRRSRDRADRSTGRRKRSPSGRARKKR